jgi:hypothetical protein
MVGRRSVFVKDFLEQEIRIGDNVVYLQHYKTSSSLNKSVVVGIADKMVKLENGKLKCPHLMVVIKNI